MLLSSRRFFPLFMTQFLGAFNDNLFKNAAVLMITFRFPHLTAVRPEILVTLAAGIFILPFFLFSAAAGQLADRADKAGIARIVKLAEIGIMFVAAAGFLLPHPGLLLATLFCMGAHSAFFGPVKYAILPQHLAADELLSGNAWVEAATFLAILTGGIAAGLLSMLPGAQVWVSIIGIAVAVTGYAFSRFIPDAPGSAPDLTVDWRFWRGILPVVTRLREDKAVFAAVLAISWFWLTGATYLSQFPAFVRNHVGGGEGVVTILLTAFSLGIAFGSLLCGRFLKGTARFTPLAAFGMGIFGVDLYFAQSLWRIVPDLFFAAACGGIFTVPLYTLVQRRTAAAIMSRTIAGLNIMNALFMVISSVVCVLLLKFSLGVPEIFLLLALLHFPAGYALKSKLSGNGERPN